MSAASWAERLLLQVLSPNEVGMQRGELTFEQFQMYYWQGLRLLATSSHQSRAFALQSERRPAELVQP